MFYFIVAIIILGSIGKFVEKLQQEKAKGTSNGSIAVAIFLVLGMFYGFTSCSLPQKSEEELRIEREGRREKPMLDFDGTIIGIKPYLKSKIADKKSIEIIKTSAWNSESNNNFSQYVEFRCRNQYGFLEIIRMKFTTTNDGMVIEGVVLN
ncbi:MAG: hypothetical protein ACRC0G_15900 [Fusobacteriaceae bacterium]